MINVHIGRDPRTHDFSVPFDARNGPCNPDERVIEEKSPIIQMHRGTGWVVNKRNVVENISRNFFNSKGREPAFSMTKRPTYVLKDFPEDYIPIDKKTTTHHHYIWIQNIFERRLGLVRVRWDPCPQNSDTETF